MTYDCKKQSVQFRRRLWFFGRPKFTIESIICVPIRFIRNMQWRTIYCHSLRTLRTASSSVVCNELFTSEVLWKAGHESFRARFRVRSDWNSLLHFLCYRIISVLFYAPSQTYIIRKFGISTSKIFLPLSGRIITWTVFACGCAYLQRCSVKLRLSCLLAVKLEAGWFIFIFFIVL